MRAAARPLRQVAYCHSRGSWGGHMSLLAGGNGHRKHEFRIRKTGPLSIVSARSASSSAALAVQQGEENGLDHTTFVDAWLERSIDPDNTDSGTNLPATLADVPRHPTSASSWKKQPRTRLARYGKWHTLATQYQELHREADISGEIGPPRLVDDPANVNDIELWNLILNFRYRQEGFDGVVAILGGLRVRKVLWEVQGPSAEAFWDTILREAVLHKDSLMSVWQYAEWMYEAHGVRFPKLHEAVLSSFIKRKMSPEETIAWHIRLSPNHGLDTPSFTQLLQRFISDPDPVVQGILAGLYQTSNHRDLYDSIVPQLYAEGHLTLARDWRFRLTVFGDNPSSFAARPFLRFMAGYFPRVNITRNEEIAAGVKKGSGKLPVSTADLEGVGGYRQLINRIHGRTFGIKEKTYNDTLGARWFASSWISVDLALDVVRFLGLDQIGPLSLQSIALREGNPDRILERIDQLELSGISIGESSYAKAIRHFATMDDGETLNDLLHSDLHPDVYENPDMQKEILRMAIKSGDFAPYRLVLSVKLAVALDELAFQSNLLALESLTTGNNQMAIRMLGDMHKRGVQILPSTSDTISIYVISMLEAGKPVSPALLDQYIVLCRLVMATRFPLATEALKTLLTRLAAEGRLEELERLSIEILQRYSAVRNSTRPTLNVHRLDVPDLLKDGEHSYGSFELIPRELNLRHDQHPIQRIFDRTLQHDIIHASFEARHVSRPLPNSAKNPHEPIDFSFARGVRLLAILRDNGVVFTGNDVKQLRRAVELHLVTLLAMGSPSDEASHVARWIAQVGLRQSKDMFDEAWGQTLLSPLDDLEEKVRTMAMARDARPRLAGGRPRPWTGQDVPDVAGEAENREPRIRIVQTGSRPLWQDLRILKKKATGVPRA